MHNVSAKESFHLDGQNPQMVTTGEPADISNLSRFGFYRWIYYNKDKFPEQKKRIGRALGPTRYEGNEMAQYILQANGIVVAQQKVKAIPPEHLRTKVLKDKIEVFDSFIKHKLGDSMCMLQNKSEHTPHEWIPYEDNETKPHTMPENNVYLDNFNVSLPDSLINAEVLLH